jgi:hypothetical protein
MLYLWIGVTETRKQDAASSKRRLIKAAVVPMSRDILSILTWTNLNLRETSYDSAFSMAQPICAAVAPRLILQSKVNVVTV